MRIDGLDDLDALVADPRDDADRAQEPRGIVDQEQEVGDAGDAEHGDDQRDELVHRLLQPVQRPDREDQREDEQADAVAHDVVAQQRRRDDPRRELPAGDLDRHEQRAEREHQERQRQRDDRLVHRLRAGDREPRELPSEPGVDAVQDAAPSRARSRSR